MKKCYLFLLLMAGCMHTKPQDFLSLVQIQDRNGLTETVSTPERLKPLEDADFLSSQPYQKVLRIFKGDGKNRSIITTYHPNGCIYQYLEAKEMRANGAYREWFANGKKKIEAKVIGGTADLCDGVQEDWLFDGISQVWDEKGNLAATISYKKGVLEGKSTYYFPNGDIHKELLFEKNALSGPSVEYDPDGNLKTTTNYLNGLKEGDCFGFFPNEAPAFVEEYQAGGLISGIYYDPSGVVVSRVEDGSGFQALFEKGQQVLIEYQMGHPEGAIREFTKEGELKRIFHIKKGQKNGEEISYYLASEIEGVAEEPLPKLLISWKSDTVQGSVKTWYNTGQLQSEREYANNIRSGPSLAWYRDGSLMLYEEYEEDRLKKGQYYQMKQNEPISAVTHGTGLATLFDETGTLIAKVKYLNGKPVVSEE